MKECFPLETNKVRCLPNQIHEWHYWLLCDSQGTRLRKLWRVLLYPSGQNRADFKMSSQLGMLSFSNLRHHSEHMNDASSFSSQSCEEDGSASFLQLGKLKNRNSVPCEETDNVLLGKPGLKHRFPHSSPIFSELYQIILPVSIRNLLVATADNWSHLL